MAAARRTVKGNGTNRSNNGKSSRKKRVRATQPEISNDDIRHMLKAPGDYQGVGGKLADAIERAGLRAPVSARKLRRMLARAARLGQRATAAQLRATAADRRRMIQDSEAWKSMLAAWRFVQAIMPEHPELEEPFAFMEDYMSVTRPPATSPPPAA